VVLARFSHQVHYGSAIDTGEIMLKKLLVTLVAAAFAAGAYAQAPKETAKPATQVEKKADSKTAKKSKGKAKSTKGKAKASK
jgi:Ni/Co efflux regulator RcnB